MKCLALENIEIIKASFNKNVQMRSELVNENIISHFKLAVTYERDT